VVSMVRPAISARSRRLMPATNGYGFLTIIMRSSVSARRPRAGLKAISRALFSPRRTSRESSFMSAVAPTGKRARKSAKLLASIIDTTLGSSASLVAV